MGGIRQRPGRPPVRPRRRVGRLASGRRCSTTRPRSPGCTPSWPPRWPSAGFASLRRGRRVRAPMTDAPFGERPRRRRRRPRAAVRGHRPARAAAGEVGPVRRPRRPAPGSPTRSSTPSPASVAVLKPQLAFYERHGSRGLAVLEDAVAAGAGRRCAGAARRQARRHRLDDGRLRRLPAARPPARRRRDDRQPLPRPRLAAAGRRHRADARRRPVRAGPHLQPRRRHLPARAGGGAVGRAGRRRHRARLEHPGLGRRRPAARHRARSATWRAGSGRRPVPSAWSSAPRCATWTSTSTGWAARSSRPGLGAQGGSVADLRRLFGTDRAVVPTVSRDVLAAGPDAAALRAAADRWTAELAAVSGATCRRARFATRRVATACRAAGSRAGDRSFRNRSVRNPRLTCRDHGSSPTDVNWV